LALAGGCWRPSLSAGFLTTLIVLIGFACCVDRVYLTSHIANHHH
jgi:hypothetical protein